MPDQQNDMQLAVSPAGDPAVPVRETHDGISVPDGYRLRFCLLETSRDKWSGVLFGVAVEWNRDGTRRRPYLVWDLGPIHGQTGWLWEGPARPPDGGGASNSALGETGREQ